MLQRGFLSSPRGSNTWSISVRGPDSRVPALHAQGLRHLEKIEKGEGGPKARAMGAKGTLDYGARWESRRDLGVAARSRHGATWGVTARRGRSASWESRREVVAPRGGRGAGESWRVGGAARRRRAAGDSPPRDGAGSSDIGILPVQLGGNSTGFR